MRVSHQLRELLLDIGKAASAEVRLIQWWPDFSAGLAGHLEQRSNEEGRPSRWKDGLTRSFMHCSRPSQYVLPLGISLAMGLKEEGRSVWLMATLGPFGPGVKRDSYGAPRRRCRGVSTDQTNITVITDEAFTVGLKSWSRGQKSQAASWICCGGVSAVMGSSDLDVHTFGSTGA